MAWIKSDSELSRNRKFFDLVSRLKVRPEDAFWNLHHFWYWCCNQFPDGVMKDVSDLAIARSAEWRGEPKHFVESLVISGFIDREPGQLRVHDWGQWMPESVEKKLSRQKSDKSPTFVGSAQYVVSSAVVLSFPVSGKTETWLLTTERLEELKPLYPGVDVLLESKRALQWLKDNPTRRKTARGMARFLSGWLERTQNRSSFRSPFQSRVISDEEAMKKLRENDDRANKVLEEFRANR